MIINGNEYKIPELNFNAMCDLEDMGVVLSNMEEKMLSTVRGFIALSMGGDIQRAGKEFEAHLASGGSIENIVEEINKAVSESGFFQALSQDKAKGYQESKRKEA